MRPNLILGPRASGGTPYAYAATLGFVAALTLKELYFHRLVGLGYNWFHMLISISLYTAMGLLTQLLPAKARIWTLLCLNLLISLIMVADLNYWRFFGDVLSLVVLAQARQLGTSLDSTARLLRGADLLFLLDLGIWTLLLGWKGTARWRQGIRPKVAVIGAAIACLIVVGGTTLLEHAVPGFFGKRWSNVGNLVNTIGVTAYHAFDAYRYVQDRNIHVTPEEVSQVKALVTSLRKDDPAMPLWGAARGKNILVIQVESMQEFVVGMSINGAEVTPNLNRLVSQSNYFPLTFDQTAQGRTSDATFLATCGLHPLSEGSVNFRYLGNQFRCLPRILKEHGYRSVSMNGYFGDFWNIAAMHEQMGFDRNIFADQFQLGEKVGWYLADEDFFRQGIEKLKGEKSPWYALLITLSSHHPYQLPSHHQHLNTAPWTDTILGDYLQAIHYADQSLGVLISELKQAGLLDDTAIILYGDHDSGLASEQVYYDFQKLQREDDFSVARLDRIPLLVHLPGQQEGRRLTQAVGLVDLPPTILGLLGIAGEEVMLGHPLFQEAGHHVAMRNGSFSDGERYFLAKDGRLESGECRRLSDGESLPSQECRPGWTLAEQKLNASDLLIKGNLVPRVRSR